MTRSELYALVWAEPGHTLARRLGLSGAGLAKLCDRHAIPIPTRGYWQRLGAGQPVGPTPLPEFAVDEVIPRFRLLDAAGAPREPGEPGKWLIPGVLRRAAPRAAATPGSAPPPMPQSNGFSKLFGPRDDGAWHGKCARRNLCRRVHVWQTHRLPMRGLVLIDLCATAGIAGWHPSGEPSCSTPERRSPCPVPGSSWWGARSSPNRRSPMAAAQP